MESTIQRLQDRAIEAAVAGDWSSAIELSKQILKLSPNNLEAHLGLGFANMQTNQLDLAARYYRKAILIEPGNHIARNNLDKLTVLRKKKVGKNQSLDNFSSSSHLKEFINVIGKTKIVELVNIGQAEVLANLKVGQHVELKAKKRRIEVRTLNGDYIGALPDDISKRLLFFIEAGSIYKVYIKSALKNQVEIFVSEDKKGAKVKNFISFPKNIQDDLKVMMQQLHKDEDGEEKHEKEGDGSDFDDDKGTAAADDEAADEGITDLEALAADLDEEPHDTFITDLSAYNEGDDEEAE